MSNNNSIQNVKDASSESIDWSIIQKDMRKKLGSDIYDSWLRKINFVEEINNYVLLSNATKPKISSLFWWCHTWHRKPLFLCNIESVKFLGALSFIFLFVETKFSSKYQ